MSFVPNLNIRPSLLVDFGVAASLANTERYKKDKLSKVGQPEFLEGLNKEYFAQIRAYNAAIHGIGIASHSLQLIQNTSYLFPDNDLNLYVRYTIEIETRLRQEIIKLENIIAHNKRILVERLKYNTPVPREPTEASKTEDYVQLDPIHLYERNNCQNSS
jgi:hypothetical protein